VSDLRGIASGIITYQVQKNRPPAATDIETLRAQLEPQYATVPKTDGWGHPFQVAVNRTDGSYVIVSAGPDGKFDKEAWNDPSRATDDIVLRNGEITRNAEPARQKIDPALAEVDRLLDEWAGYRATLQRFEALRR
jgi:hypothetical protein